MSSASTPPARRDRIAARQHLEHAAAQLFAEQGYAATTVDQIVALTGVSKPALYRHFESKKELYLTLLRRHREELAAVALAEIGTGQELATVLPAMVEAWFAHVEQDPYTWRMLFRDTTGDPDIEALHAELHRDQVAADIALLRLVHPPLPPDELEPLGEIIRSSLAGLALWWLEHPATPRSVLVAAILRMARGILAGDR